MRIVALAIQMLVSVSLLPAEDPLARYVDGGQLTILRAAGSSRASLSTQGTLSLLPRVSSRDSIAADVKAFRPTVGVEFLRMVSSPAVPASTPEGWLRIYNVLHAVSTMQGMTYWSITSKSQEVLFKQSYVIASPRSPRRLPDPVFSGIPPEDRLYTYQEDRSFGRNTYEESFSSLGDHLLVTAENLTSISLLLIPVIQSRSFTVRFVLVPVGRDVLFYGIAMLRTTVPLGDRRSREESLSNRLIAMANWLGQSIASRAASKNPRSTAAP